MFYDISSIQAHLFLPRSEIIFVMFESGFGLGKGTEGGVISYLKLENRIS